MRTEIAKEMGNIRQCPICLSTVTHEFLRAPDRYHGRTQMYQLTKCLLCEVVWLEGAPKPEELEEHYGSDYDLAIANTGEESQGRWQDRTKTLLEYKQRGAILDLGCSSGSFLTTLQGQNWDLYGIEMSQESAKRASQRCGAKLFVGDIVDASFASESFDVITCFHVFEHLYNPRAVLAKIYAWLKPGGIFYALMPNIDSAGARVFGTYWYALELPRHLYHWSPKSLSTMARSIGFEVTSLITGREVFIEQSTYYIIDAILMTFGMTRRPLSKSTSPGILWRIIRKAYRMTLSPLLTGLISLAGDGESIHAVFTKPTSSRLMRREEAIFGSSPLSDGK